MRIISGAFKGKKIIEPTDSETRPLKDLTKESIFNIIEHSNKFKIDLKNSNILDLFSGVGSFGIECLSRGAQNVVFIENYQGVLPILKKNLANLKSTKNYEIIEKDIINTRILCNLNDRFDIIFLDPPYKDKNLEKLLINIYDEKILKKSGIVVIHRHKKGKEIFPRYYQILLEKKYGISKIVFLSFLNQ
tara:strand:+ start:151 stop:720 length:570 start_codon:yes stop_codon:yes gene_type:complete